jgi:hypothetical protein
MPVVLLSIEYRQFPFDLKIPERPFLVANHHVALDWATPVHESIDWRRP